MSSSCNRHSNPCSLLTYIPPLPIPFQFLEGNGEGLLREYGKKGAGIGMTITAATSPPLISNTITLFPSMQWKGRAVAMKALMSKGVLVFDINGGEVMEIASTTQRPPSCH